MILGEFDFKRKINHWNISYKALEGEAQAERDCIQNGPLERGSCEKIIPGFSIR